MHPTIIREMTRDIKDLNLKTCPKCGASWEALEDSLNSIGEDHANAILIIYNCPICKARFIRR